MTLQTAYDTLKQGSLWAQYAAANQGEAQKLDEYVQALTAGQTPAPPQLATKTGQGLAAILSLTVKADIPAAVAALKQADKDFWAAWDQL